MAVRTDVFLKVGGFRTDFGKVGTISRPEDTDLCIRMGKTSSQASIFYAPSAWVDHHVGDERARFRFFLRRCYLEGRGKVELAKINEGVDDLGDERTYLLQTIPEGLGRYLRNAVTRSDLDEFLRGGAVMSGIAAAAAGGAASLLNNLVSAASSRS